MPVKSNRALKEMLQDENRSIDHAESQHDKIKNKILAGLQKWDPTIDDYDPLIEIAKLGIRATADGEDQNLALRAHTELAHHMYPQIGRVEIKTQEDKKIDINIHIDDYAKGSTIEVEPEDIEVEGDIDAEKPRDYTEYVLKSLPKRESESH